MACNRKINILVWLRTVTHARGPVRSSSRISLPRISYHTKNVVATVVYAINELSLIKKDFKKLARIFFWKLRNIQILWSRFSLSWEQREALQIVVIIRHSQDYCCIHFLKLLLASISSNVLLGRGSAKTINKRRGLSNVFPSAALVYIWLLIIMRWQVHHLSKLNEKVVRFEDSGTHWWPAPLYQKQQNRSGLNNWLDCLASWYTPNFRFIMYIPFCTIIHF